ncbi:MAG: DnaJ domain-containing protein [Aminobacteriaceae bacterium]
MLLFRLLLRAAPVLLFMLFSKIMRDAIRGSGIPPGPGPSGNAGKRPGTGEAGRTRDPYLVLGCSRSASDEDIKRRYRELTARYHPDKFIGQKLDDEFVQLASKRFQEIQDAYGRIRSARGL